MTVVSTSLRDPSFTPCLTLTLAQFEQQIMKTSQSPLSWYERRVRPLAWDLEPLAERSRAIRSQGIINKRAETTRYSIRALRYWWLRNALIEELRFNPTATVADFGCSSGHFKQFFGESHSAKWVGFDWQIDEPRLKSVGYSECVNCDFDAEIPYPSESADVIIFSHVIEHLPRPGATVAEIARILRPGGVLLAGSPVAPYPFSTLRDWHHRRKLRLGKTKIGGHINSMDSLRWKEIVSNAELRLEMMHGAFLCRWSGNRLENYGWWIRLNNLWGVLFPSWAGEIYLSARKIKADKCMESNGCPAPSSNDSPQFQP